MGRGKNMTEEECVRILRYHKNGWSTKAIARECGRSSAVVRRVTKLRGDEPLPELEAPPAQQAKLPTVESVILNSPMPENDKLQLLKTLWGVQQ